MKLNLDIYTPLDNRYPGTLVIAPYPFNGIEETSRERYQMTANDAGVAIGGMRRRGAGKATDLLLPQTWWPYLSEENFDDMAATFGDHLRDTPEWKGADTHVGWADSASGMLVMGAQVHTDERWPLFDGLLLRDCIQHRTPVSPREAREHFIRYTRRDEPLLPPDEDAPSIPKPHRTGPNWHYTVRGGLRTIGEIVLTQKLMRGPHSRTLALALASGQPELPMSYHGLEHSFTGSKEQAEATVAGLKRARENTALRATPAPLLARVDARRHSQLVTRPDLAANDLKETLKDAMGLTPRDQ